jgi:hypothetical protein
MNDYSDIYVATKETSPSKKHGSRSLSNGSTNTLQCSTVVIAKGEMRLVSMVSKGCALQLVYTFFNHDLTFQ